MRFRAPVPGSGDAGLRLPNFNDPDDDNSDEEELAFDYANHAPLEVLQHPRVNCMRRVIKMNVLDNRFRQLCLCIEQLNSIRPSTSQSKCTVSNCDEKLPFSFTEEPPPVFLTKIYNARRNRNTLLYYYEKLFILDEEDYDPSSIPP